MKKLASKGLLMRALICGNVFLGSTVAFAEDVQASLDAGMNAHLSKPIVIEEVIKTILRYVHND